MTTDKAKLTRHVMDSLNVKDFNILHNKWLIIPNADRGFLKYFDIPYHVNQAIDKVYEAYYDGEPPICSSVADISAGFGWFPYVLSKLGMNVITTDVNDERNEMCVDARQALGLAPSITFKYWEKKWKPLPEQIRDMDLISCIAVGGQDSWDIDTWYKFIEDAMVCLRPGGRLYLSPNKSPQTKDIISCLPNLVGNIKNLSRYKSYSYSAVLFRSSNNE